MTSTPASRAPWHETDARDARIGAIEATRRPSLVQDAASSGLIEIHALPPDERRVLLSIHERLGSQSRRQRYLAPKGPLSENDLDLLSAVDGHNHVALAAFAGARADPVGVARYVRHSDARVAETAVEVVDEWQRRGVGRLLMTRLRAHALRAGIRRFEWTAFESNGAVAALARDLSDVRARRIGAGVTQWSAAITGLAVGKQREFLHGAKAARYRYMVVPHLSATLASVEEALLRGKGAAGRSRPDYSRGDHSRHHSREETMSASERMATDQQSGPETIRELVRGFMISKHLFVANEIGLFTALAEGPATLEQLAGITGVPARTLRIVADAMVALALLDRDENRYRNGVAADACLSGRGPMNMGPLLRFANAISYPLWLGLEQAVRTSEPARGELTEEQQKIFSEGVEAGTAAAAHALASGYDFARHRRLLDVGGGTGSFLVAILSANPELEGTLFDRPEVAEIAERKLAASPVADRVSITAGDAMESDLPGGHDAVLAANIVHYFLPGQVAEFVGRIRAAVEPNARLLLVDWWTDPTHTEPLGAALMAGEFLAHVGGDVYSEEEMNSWLAETGWRPLEKLPLAGPISAIVAEAV